MRASLSLLAALVVFAGGRVLLARFIHGEQQRDAELQRFLALQELAAHRARVEGRLASNLISMRTLRAEIALNPDLDPVRFERLVSELLTADLHTRHIAAAPDLVICYIYPRSGNEAALGFDYRTSAEQADRLSELGCHMLQGYYFGRPMPLADLLANHGDAHLSRR